MAIQINGPQGQRIRLEETVADIPPKPLPVAVGNTLAKSPPQINGKPWGGTITGSLGSKPTPSVTLPPKAQAYADAHPQVVRWVTTNAKTGNTFAKSLLSGLIKFGNLTPKQQACVEKNLHKDSNPAPAVVFGTEATSGLIALFDTAKKALKWPKLHVFGFIFSKAGDKSKNPGHLYVKRESDGMYMGKITPKGMFLQAYKTSPEEVAQIAKIGEQPVASIFEHGKNSGNCACCNAKLTDPKSLAAGIGPVCAKNWGLPWGEEVLDVKKLAQDLGVA